MKSVAVRLELLALTATAIIVALVRDRLPRVLALGTVLVAGALLLLVQGAVRDLARLATADRAAPSRKVTCVCVESVLGLATIAAGIALSVGWSPMPVHVGPAAWPLAVACVGLFGMLTREIVFDWRTLRLRREVDHGARVVWRDRRP